jgi:hypothetical protein
MGEAMCVISTPGGRAAKTEQVRAVGSGRKTKGLFFRNSRERRI